MINWARVNELTTDIGPDDIDEVIELFLCEVEEVIEKLTVKNDQYILEQHMHFLKGSALNLGFDGLGELCSDAEKLAAKGKADQVSVPTILASYQRSKSEFLQGAPFE